MIVYMDIDGTLVPGVAPAGGVCPPDTFPFPGASESLREIVRQGHTIVYWTGRESRWRQETFDWLLRFEFPLGDIRMVDAKFTGDWPAHSKAKLALLREGPGDSVVVDDMDSYLDVCRAHGFRTVCSRGKPWSAILAEILA